MSVDLPDPVAPTKAAVCPASILQRHVIEDGFLAARIREDEIADLDAASNLERSALRRDTGVVDFRNGVEDFAHALPGSHPPLKDVGDPAERNHRP